MLESMGRKLGRWFGWERGRFVERVKVEEGRRGRRRRAL
jgi:hypothetical protein